MGVDGLVVGAMNAEVLAAIREANEIGTSKIEWCGYGHHETETMARRAIDMLLAEVGRLRAVLENIADVDGDCPHTEKHDVLSDDGVIACLMLSAAEALE
jgi:hypothetical protein